MNAKSMSRSRFGLRLDRSLLSDRTLLTRILLSVFTIAMLIATLLLMNATRSAEQTTRSAASAVASNPQTLEQFAATWRANVAKTADQVTVNWSVRDARDLRGSLAAFDATQSKSPRINVVRRDGAFAVTAELSP
jgi:hypothetical protein